MSPASFCKPHYIRDLELLRLTGASLSQEIQCPAGRYPEAFFRLKVQLTSPEDLYSDDEELVRTSSPLFWDEGTPAQILLAATLPDGGSWTLSLTRWGVLRWEYRAQGSAQPAESLEPKWYSLQPFVDLAQPFYVGLTLTAVWDGTNVRKLRARLYAGQGTGQKLCLLATKAGMPGDSLPVLPERLVTGRGFQGELPVHGRVEELLVGNSDQARLFDDCGEHAGIDASFSGGSCLWSGWRDSETISVVPGASFGTTWDNYWYCFKVTDPAIRRIHFQRLGNMNTSFFVSDGKREEWKMIPAVISGTEIKSSEYWEGVVNLPEWTGPLFVSNAPVYGEMERDRDLGRVKELGCDVSVIAESTLGNPIHLVTLTDPSVPLREKTGILLLCGQHSPVEQMGGMLGLPCIEELVRLNREGRTKDLLRSFVFYWIPIFNIDCARYGTPGNDARLRNPNRCWFKDHGPEQTGVEQHFLELKQQGLQMGLMMDIHVGMWRNHTLLTDYDRTVDDPADKPLCASDLQKKELFERLNEIAGLREIWNNSRTTVKVRAPEWFQETFQCPAFTIECSVVSYHDPVTRKTLPFTQESFREMGTNLGRFYAECAEKMAGGRRP